MTRYVKLGVIVLLMGSILGCKTIERKWTEEKDYIFISNYSTLNPLGLIVEDDLLTSNPLFKTTCVRGNINNETRSQEDQFEVKGKVEVETILKKISDGKVEGDFSRVSKAYLQLVNPFHEMADCFIPTAPCDDRQMQVVTDTINVGDIEVRLEDRNGVNITSEFKLSPAAAAEVGAEITTGSIIKRSGSGYYTGYRSKHVRCKAASIKQIRLERGEQFKDNETGLSVVYLDHRILPPYIEVLIHIIPSKFDRRLSLEEVHVQFDTTNWLDNLTEEERQAMWEKALKTPSQGEAISVRNPDFLKLQFGSQFGMPIVPSESGMYIEVGAITTETVALNVQRINYEDVEPE